MAKMKELRREKRQKASRPNIVSLTGTGDESIRREQ